jgi:hypothetical protein
MSPAGFEPASPASEQPQTHALDRPATGMRLVRQIVRKKINREIWTRNVIDTTISTNENALLACE